MQSKIASPTTLLPKIGSQFALAAVSLATAMLLAPGGAQSAPPERSSEGPWVKGRVLVMPNPGLSEAELGKIVGCSREMAGRVLKSLEQDGLVSVSGKTMVVYGTR